MDNTRAAVKRKHSEVGGLDYSYCKKNQTGNIEILENKDKDKFKSKGQITLKVDQFSEFANGQVGSTRRWSERVYIRGFPWLAVIDLKEKNNRKWLGFFVYCAQSNNYEWSCDASYTLILKSHKENQKDYELNNHRQECNSKNVGWWICWFKKCNKLLNSTNGWLQDDTITLTVNITVNAGSDGICKFTPENLDILYVNGNAVEVNKLCLASQSHYFNSMFFEDFKEKRDQHFKIDDPELDLDDFKLLLDLSNSFVHRILPEVKIEKIMELSDEYVFPFVMGKCERALEKEECKKSFFEKFRLASKFRRNDFKAILLGLLTKKKLNKMIKDHFGDYKKLEGDMMRELVDNIPDE